MDVVSLRDAREQSKQKGSNEKFDGVRIPFFSVGQGKTKLLFLSDLDHVDNGDIPPVTFYRYYRLPNPVHLQGQRYESYEVVYNSEDELEPGYERYMKREKKPINPRNMPIKGFTYVANLTGLRAMQLFNERGGDENSPLEGKGAIITSKDFGGIKNVNEVKAAKAYIAQQQQFISNLKKYAKENGKEYVEPTYHGIAIYNFPVTITKALTETLDTLEAEGDEMENIRLKDYIFALTKEGVKKDTSYSFTIEAQVDELDDELVKPVWDFLDENDSLTNFEGLIDRKRYKNDDDLDKEFKISDLSDDDDDDEDTTDWR